MDDLGVITAFLLLSGALLLVYRAWENRPSARARAVDEELMLARRRRLVLCAHCGVLIDSANAALPLLATNEDNQTPERWICLDRLKCHERADPRRFAAELRTDLEVAQAMIEELQAQLTQAKEELALAHQALPTQEATR